MIACDYLACGFGLVPNTELATLLGCKVEAGSLDVDEWQQTSVPGVYGAGEVTGIGGSELAEREGEIAGFAAAGQQSRARATFRARARAQRFAATLNRAFALRNELRTLPRPDTIVCRCEDVCWEKVRRQEGWRETKLKTRCGMGPCQGRVYGPAIEFLLGWERDGVRPPLHPVPAAHLVRTL